MDTDCSLGDTPGASWDRVKRWDMYDIADELADLPGMLLSGRSPRAVAAIIEDLERRLWVASERGGRVGPWPEYQPYSDV